MNVHIKDFITVRKENILRNKGVYMLTRITKILVGQHPELSGDCSGLRGDCSGLSGDCSGLSGDWSGLGGNLNSIPMAERADKPNVNDWVEDSTE